MKHKKRTIHSKSSQQFNYTGDITIKVTEGNRVYSETHCHNNGAIKLFNFFADCLIGNFNIARSSRPCRIVLFKATDTETTETGGSGDWVKPDDFPNNLQWDDDTRVSTKVLYDSAATPGASETDGSTVTYHFRIPYLALVDGQIVRKLALYPDMISDYKADRCAYYLLSDDEKIVIPGPDGVNSNYTIIIDWKLHIYNANSN